MIGPVGRRPGSFFTPHSMLELIEQAKPHWERDSSRVLEYRGTDDCVQNLFSTTSAGGEEAVRGPAVGLTHVDLSQPTERGHGRYWDNPHMVLVVDGHARLTSWSVLNGLRDVFWRIAARKGYAASRLSVMPSHIHAALRAEPDTAPLEIVFSHQDNLAHLLQPGRVCSTGFYVGTFGGYSMQAVRNPLAAPVAHHLLHPRASSWGSRGRSGRRGS